MRILKTHIKFMNRYHADIGKLRRVKLYSKIRLNIISNKVYLLKDEAYKLKSQTALNTEGNLRKISNLKKVLKASYMLGEIVYKAKIKKKKINKEERDEVFMNWLLNNRVFRRVYNNLKKRQLKKLYSQQKGNFEKIQVNLEKRLDMILMRSGLTFDLSESRQILNHKIVEVNGEIVTSYGRIINVGDLITLRHSLARTYLINKRLGLLKLQREERKQRLIYKKTHRMKMKSAAWKLLNLRLKLYTIKSPSYLETNIPLYATTLIYEPQISEITYPFTILVNPASRFISGLNLYKRIGK